MATVKETRRMCPLCGTTFYNPYAHVEECPGKLAGSPFRPCGRTVLLFGGRVRGKCWLLSGHEGPCE